MRLLGIELTEHTPEILQTAADVLAEMAVALPPGHSLEALSRVVIDLADASLLHPLDIAAHERKVAAAVEYGERRNAEGLPESLIYAEFAAIREALRCYLGSCKHPRRVVREARIRLDMAAGVAELAAVRGYHRAAFEQAGLWETLTGRLAQESPLLNLPAPTERLATSG